MDLDIRFNTLIKQNKFWQPGQPIIVAVSTGIDSMVLLTLLQHLQLNKPKIIIAHVNHQLRSQSKIEEKFIRNYAKQNGLTLEVAHWNHDVIDKGMEVKARDFRYNFFKQLMAKYDAHVLVTAHQQNDQAETILMKLIRSGNLNEVSGMKLVRPFANGELVRPLLDVSRASIDEYAHENNIKWYEDETNHEDMTIRNRIRHKILPILIKENKDALQHFSDFAKTLQKQNQENQILANKLIQKDKLTLKSNKVSYDTTGLNKVPNALLKALARRLKPELFLPIKYLNKIQELINNKDRPQGEIDLKGEYYFKKNYANIEFLHNSQKKKEKPAELANYMIVLNHWYNLSPSGKFGIFTVNKMPKNKYTRESFFDLQDTQFPLHIRKTNYDDKIRLKNGGSKKARRIFIDQKIANQQRENAISLVTNDDHVLSIIGISESSLPPKSNANQYVLLVDERNNNE